MTERVLLAWLIFASAPAWAEPVQCENTGKSCIEAKRSYQRLCARVGSSAARRDCYALGEAAHEKCLKTGQWVTEQCNLSGLTRN